MTQLYAQPYDLSATGFYFKTTEEFAVKSAALRNDYGEPVEEFEIQFIDGEEIDYDLAGAMGLNQVNFAQYLSAVDNCDDEEKRTVIIAVGECGYTFEADLDPTRFDVEIFEIASMRDLAEQFVDEGLFGEVPEAFQNYIDYDAIARDLAVEYSEIVIAGVNYIYACR
ncbi:antirestriction protein ArdA [Parasedimentitalea maritima]|uniref:Antirestriction protein ArdA n=1 Tax=Parasedimentitalea maritima TaxID=2578117 RepID=A0ABY2UNJ4_9RHOB|nr:antirestriction protein ArdA [Zongyanglinia marina]TLP55486.1 antirestriction protein ArdA [Zongyanglinia marina]